MASIKKIFAYEIIDSRGIPTLEGRLSLDNNKEVVSSIPSGTSVGKYEAIELRDGETNRFLGQGVSRAVGYINDLIGPKLIGISPDKQNQVDDWLVKADGTKNKSKLGANTTLLISQLVARAAACDKNLPLFKYINQLLEKNSQEKIKIERIPNPVFNIINGGKHAHNNLEIQEFWIIPSSTFTFSKAYQTGVELFHELKKILNNQSANVAVGEEGGFTPALSANIDALEILIEAVISKQLKIGLDIFLGLDLAASNFFKNDHYYIKDINHPLKSSEFIDYLLKLVKKYSILVVEDPLNEDSWEDWTKLNSLISKEVYLVGDDLLATNKQRLEKAIKTKACNTVLIKPNQIGTVTETLNVITMARKNDINYMVSHRSGETNDSFIADFAVGVQADFVKFGAPCRGERVAKYNRLWQIEREEL